MTAIELTNDIEGKLCEALKQLSRENPYVFFPIFTPEEQTIMRQVIPSLILKYYYFSRCSCTKCTLRASLIVLFNLRNGISPSSIQLKIAGSYGKGTGYIVQNQKLGSLIDSKVKFIENEFSQCINGSQAEFSNVYFTTNGASTRKDYYKSDEVTEDYGSRLKPHKDRGSDYNHLSSKSRLFVLIPFIGKSTWFFPFEPELYRADLYQAYDNGLDVFSKDTKIVNEELAYQKERMGEYQEVLFAHAAVAIYGILEAAHSEPITLDARVLARINCLRNDACHFKEPLTQELMETGINNVYPEFDCG